MKDFRFPFLFLFVFWSGFNHLAISMDYPLLVNNELAGGAYLLIGHEARVQPLSVVPNRQNFIIERWLANHTLDSTFGTNGMVVIQHLTSGDQSLDPTDVTVLPNGKIAVLFRHSSNEQFNRRIVNNILMLDSTGARNCIQQLSSSHELLHGSVQFIRSSEPLNKSLEILEIDGALPQTILRRFRISPHLNFENQSQLVPDPAFGFSVPGEARPMGKFKDPIGAFRLVSGDLLFQFGQRVSNTQYDKTIYFQKVEPVGERPVTTFGENGILKVPASEMTFVNPLQGEVNMIQRGETVIPFPDFKGTLRISHGVPLKSELQGHAVGMVNHNFFTGTIRAGETKQTGLCAYVLNLIGEGKLK